MANVTIPKEQQTAYERWEMVSFSEDAQADRRSIASPNKKTEAPLDDNQLSKILEGVRQEAYNKGMQEGYAVGMASAREQAQADKQRFLSLMNSFTDALEQSDERIAEDVLSLALDVAKAMLKVKLNVDSKVLLPVVLDAIHYLPQIQKPARLLVHRDDVQVLREYLADELAHDHWQIQEDANVERGGCVVETGANQVDATNATRWKRLTEALSQTNDWLLP